MKQFSVSALLLLLTFQSSAGLQESEYKISDWIKSFNNIKDGILKLHTYYTYFKHALDVALASDGQCQFQCADGGKPFPRPGYNPSPDGCSTPLIGFHFDSGIPSITNCCNQHDLCYDTCGRSKRDCDQEFQVCLKTICRNLLYVLGLDQSVQVCESGVSLVFDAVMHLGCKPYLDSQGVACICHYQEKTDL